MRAAVRTHTCVHVTAATLTILLTLALPRAAQAFCGFYVSGADASLTNAATMVVMMREGTRTVLSMQNDYQGPPEDFAMVVPVPVVLEEENVETLPREIFAKVDRLAAPRLVEYWEQDPCYRPRTRRRASASGASASQWALGGLREERSESSVTVEASFAVGEYDIVILSARDSNGLDAWLREEGYDIPDGAEAVLRPYVEQGTKFFVAKVDVERVTFEDGRAVLSPLRVHYDAETFSLPVRLGLLNSGGTQDLVVHILASQRYEAANYDNVPIPTNLRVYDAVRRHFGRFYAALLDRTLETHPKAVVTEYAWNARSCDPCPTPPLGLRELTTLGGDVIPSARNGRFTLTRLHHRYEQGTLGEDLVFRPAQPLVGGRGMPNRVGQMEDPTREGGHVDNFQGRYAILHRWDGPLTCENPIRGRWGGPPSGARAARGPTSAPAMDSPTLRNRRFPLERAVKDPAPSIRLVPRWLQRHRDAEGAWLGPFLGDTVPSDFVLGDTVLDDTPDRPRALPDIPGAAPDTSRAETAVLPGEPYAAAAFGGLLLFALLRRRRP